MLQEWEEMAAGGGLLIALYDSHPYCLFFFFTDDFIAFFAIIEYNSKNDRIWGDCNG